MCKHIYFVLQQSDTMLKVIIIMYLNVSDQGNRTRTIQQSTVETSNLNDYDNNNYYVYSVVMNNKQIINSQCTCMYTVKALIESIIYAAVLSALLDSAKAYQNVLTQHCLANPNKQ